MKTWQFIWRLLCYRPWLYIADILNMILALQFNVVIGLLIQAFFNALPATRDLTFNIWGILLGMVGAALLNFALRVAGVQAYIIHRFCVNGLLFRNLLQRILERPGARAVPGSPGEAISNFRDDVEIVDGMIT